MTQRRRTKAEQRIRQALAHLLRTKGFDALTVSDVAREAGINRGTFHAHYVDKFDLMDRQVRGVIDDIKAMPLGPSTDPDNPHELVPRAAIVAALRFICDNYKFVAAVIWLWLRIGCVEPPETICDYILTNQNLAPAQLLD